MPHPSPKCRAILVSEAMQRIHDRLDEPGGFLLWQARISASDALAAVRAHGA